MLENTDNRGQPPALKTAAVKPESWQLKLPGFELGERNFGGNGDTVPRLALPGAISPLPNDASADIINPYENSGRLHLPSAGEESRYRDYLKSTLRQAVLGNFTDDLTLLGTALQVGLGFTGLDLPADIRDLTYDLTNWEWSPEHVGQTLLDALGLVPLIGVVKNADEAAALLKGAGKHADEAADLAKGIGRSADEAAQGAGNVGKIITEIKYKPSSGVSLKANPNKTTTILGIFEKDMRNIVNEMGNVKSTYFGAKQGGFNILNVPDEMSKSTDQFWSEVNKPWLDEAIKRGDDIVLATKPEGKYLYRFNTKTHKREISGFGREYNYLMKNGYVYDDATNMMTRR